MAVNGTNASVRNFIHDSVALSDDEFEEAMRLENNDDDINEVEIVALPLENNDDDINEVEIVALPLDIYDRN